MSEFKIGCGSITWGSEEPKRDVDPLEEIAQAGYIGAPCGPRGGTPQETIKQYASYGLIPAPGYLGANFWAAEEAADICERAKELADFMAGVGCTEVFVASGGFGSVVCRSGRTRHEASANVQADDMLTDDQFKQFAETLTKVGEITLASGVKSCFHNHVGSFIETREEIDKLFGLVDRSVMWQGPDIGHLQWAGVDPIQFCEDYAQDIISVHIKDIAPEILAKGVAEGWHYRQFSDAGIFAELGEGMVDFPAMFKILEGVAYKGWIIVETDKTMKATALESAIISREYLKSLGY